MIYSRIIGTGSYLPERLLTNADFEKMIDTTDQWIVDRTGIKELFSAFRSTSPSVVHIAFQGAC